MPRRARRGKKRSVTDTKRWPDLACEQRNAAAEEAVQAVRMLRPLVKGELFDRTETLRRQAVALSAAERIVGLMLEAGAPVRVSDL